MTDRHSFRLAGHPDVFDVQLHVANEIVAGRGLRRVELVHVVLHFQELARM